MSGRADESPGRDDGEAVIAAVIGEGATGDVDLVLPEALEVSISASLDDELPAAEAAALRARLAAEPALAERARAFEEVDAALRQLAELESTASGETEVDEAGLAALRARLESEVRGSWLRGLPLATALAAAAVLALWLRADPASIPGGDPGVGSGSEPAPGAVAEITAENDAMEILPGVPLEDFELVDQLELLDFLVQRQAEGQG